MPCDFVAEGRLKKFKGSQKGVPWLLINYDPANHKSTLGNNCKIPIIEREIGLTRTEEETDRSLLVTQTLI